jgi:steroid delta-isomerase-like uncharacterized protein
LSTDTAFRWSEWLARHSFADSGATAGPAIAHLTVRRQHNYSMQSNSSIVRGFVEEVLNQGHTDLAGKFFWEDMVEQAPLPGQGPGLEGLKEVLCGLRLAFPDMQWSVEEQIAEGDKVLTRFEWTGTHRGAFLGVPATNRPVRVWGMVIDRLENGRIKDTRIIMDTLGLMMQLGAFPPPPP